MAKTLFKKKTAQTMPPTVVTPKPIMEVLRSRANQVVMRIGRDASVFGAVLPSAFGANEPQMAIISGFFVLALLIVWAIRYRVSPKRKSLSTSGVDVPLTPYSGKLVLGPRPTVGQLDNISWSGVADIFSSAWLPLVQPAVIHALRRGLSEPITRGLPRSVEAVILDAGVFAGAIAPASPVFWEFEAVDFQAVACTVSGRSAVAVEANVRLELILPAGAAGKAIVRSPLESVRASYPGMSVPVGATGGPAASSPAAISLASIEVEGRVRMLPAVAERLLLVSFVRGLRVTAPVTGLGVADSATAAAAVEQAAAAAIAGVMGEPRRLCLSLSAEGATEASPRGCVLLAEVVAWAGVGAAQLTAADVTLRVGSQVQRVTVRRGGAATAAEFAAGDDGGVLALQVGAAGSEAVSSPGAVRDLTAAMDAQANNATGFSGTAAIYFLPLRDESTAFWAAAAGGGTPAAPPAVRRQIDGAAWELTLPLAGVARGEVTLRLMMRPRLPAASSTPGVSPIAAPSPASATSNGYRTSYAPSLPTVPSRSGYAQSEGGTPRGAPPRAEAFMRAMNGVSGGESAGELRRLRELVAEKEASEHSSAATIRRLKREQELLMSKIRALEQAMAGLRD